ncbi:hypothetical protein K466DRAFT_404199 [Polyporus arcularius HHB13444]|uniref:Uncharacterized protein n=1 Tax=Polyporus arcularius HHB13444 TaxID=1314778 RepID=A0A5C3PLF7_9APHY|nr:hypothetical protein K466DRAFT_404199 [Polyporus arcularius HHB13444]
MSSRRFVLVLIKPERLVKRIFITLSAHSGVDAMMNIMRHGQSVRGKALSRDPAPPYASPHRLWSKRAAPRETTALYSRLVASPAFKPPHPILVASVRCLIDLTQFTRLGSLWRQPRSCSRSPRHIRASALPSRLSIGDRRRPSSAPFAPYGGSIPAQQHTDHATLSSGAVSPHGLRMCTTCYVVNGPETVVVNFCLKVNDKPACRVARETDERSGIR